MDKGTTTIHLALAALRVTAWWEYVESAANWSDGASREGSSNLWMCQQGFEVAAGEIPLWPWMASEAEREEYIKAWAAKATLG